MCAAAGVYFWQKARRQRSQPVNPYSGFMPFRAAFVLLPLPAGGYCMDTFLSPSYIMLGVVFPAPCVMTHRDSTLPEKEREKGEEGVEGAE